MELMQYVYTAHYDMAVNNPISDIDNEYLPPLSIFADSTDNMIVFNYNSSSGRISGNR